MGPKPNEIEDVTFPSSVGIQWAQEQFAVKDSHWRGKARTKNEWSALYEGLQKQQQAKGSYTFPGAIMSIPLYVKG